MILLCPLAIAFSPAIAQNTHSDILTIEECRALAGKNYPEIKQYDLISRSRQYTISNAGKSYLPQVTLFGQATCYTTLK